MSVMQMVASRQGMLADEGRRYERWRCQTPWQVPKLQRAVWIWFCILFDLVLVGLKSEASSCRVVRFVQHGQFYNQWLTNKVLLELTKSVAEGRGCKGFLERFQRIMQWSGALAFNASTCTEDSKMLKRNLCRLFTQNCQSSCQQDKGCQASQVEWLPK